MDVSRIYNSIRSNAEQMSPETPTKIMVCRIVKVYPDSLTVDVQLPEISAVLNSIPLCFPGRGYKYGAFFMPREGATHLIVFTNTRRSYILAQAPLSANQSSFDSILQGENNILGFGGGYLKNDVTGNVIATSSFGNSVIESSLGINGSYSLGKVDSTMSSKTIEGIGLGFNSDLKNEAIKSGEMKMVSLSEYYQMLDIPKVYDYPEIMGSADGESFINEELRIQILDSATVLRERIMGENGFSSFLKKFKDDISAPELSDEEMSTIITDALSGIKNNFNISSKGVKIVVERGNAVNKNIDNMRDIMTLKSSDFDVSEQGNSICLRLSVKDAVTDEVKAVASIDTEGNCHFKFKSLKIEVEAGGYNLLEV